MTRTIYLNGKMGELFGEVWKLNAATVAECMHGIDCQREGKLKQYLLDCTEKGIMFTVQRGKEFLDYDNLQMNLAEDDLIITPVPAGSGNKLLKVIVGFALLVLGGWAALAAAGAATTAGAIGYMALATAAGLIGSALLNSGMAEYMAPKKPGEQGDAFLFDGPVNNTKQGIPVPLAYGQLMVGGTPIAFGFTDRETTASSGFTFKSGTSVAYATDGQFPPNSGVSVIAEETTPSTVAAQKPVSIDWNFSKGEI
jgi:predicted phage tail protein